MRKLWLMVMVVTLAGCVAGGIYGGSNSVARADARDDATLRMDTRISSEVRYLLYRDAKLADADIRVTTHEAVVTLSGKVLSETQKDYAIKLARSVNGVKDVLTDMSVAR